MGERQRPRLAVWKFASCDGCQLSLLGCEDELLTLASVIEIANFPEASSAISDGPMIFRWSKARSPRRMTQNASRWSGSSRAPS